MVTQALLIVVAIIGIIAAIAVPGLLRARMSGNEASAIGSLRAINSAQSIYAGSCGAGFYADTLSGLGTPPTVGGGDGFIGTDLSADPSVKSSYTIALTHLSGSGHKYGHAPRASRRPSHKARGGSIPAVFDRRGTPWGGMHRRPNAVVFMTGAT